MSRPNPEDLFTCLYQAGMTDDAVRRVIFDPKLAALWVSNLATLRHGDGLRRLYDDDNAPIKFNGTLYSLPDFLRFRLEGYFPQRVYGRLAEADILTFGELLEYSEGELLDIRRVGVVLTTELKKVLKERTEFGLSLHGPSEPGFVRYPKRLVRWDRALAREALRWRPSTALTDVDFAYCDADSVRRVLEPLPDIKRLEELIFRAMLSMRRPDATQELTFEEKSDRVRLYVVALTRWLEGIQ